MYLARFEVAGEQWLQACIRLDFSESSSSDTKWAQLLNHLVSDLGTYPELRFGYRFSLRERSLERSIFLLSKATYETQLRQRLASFTRLSLLVGGSVQFPQSRQEHDDCTSSFPRYRCLLVPPAYNLLNDSWIACDFHGLSLIDELSRAASVLGHEFSYQGCFEPMHIDTSVCRYARKNVLRLQGLSGIPEALVLHQEHLSRKLDNAGFLVDEIFGATSTDAAKWLHASLHRRFADQYNRMRIEAPEFSFDEGDYELALSAIRQRSAVEELSVQEICSLYVAAEELVKLLAWCPSKEIHRSRISKRQEQEYPEQPSEPLAAESLSSLDIPEPSGKGEDYIFISYKREDMPRIAPILRRLADWGYAIWYDSGISGGSEWLSVIEEHLIQCRLVVVFISQKAIESRYVRREVEVADTVNKMIIPVHLDTVESIAGMRLLLSHLQAIKCSDPLGMSRLKEAIEHCLSRRR